jgi:NAD+ diphosphatase
VVIPIAQPETDALAFAFAGGRILVLPSLDVPAFAQLGEALAPAAGPIALGRIGDRPCYAVALPEGEPPEGLTALHLRELFARIEDGPLVSMAARASQTLDWWFGHAFCGRCGRGTEAHATEMARACPGCGALHFPRINPAVITLVHRGDEVLLAHDRRFRRGFFALLAGFVEPGETLEEAVAREVREEVGLEVEDVRYMGSQAWPFPSQLMVGFFARYRTGEIRVQEEELTEAHWFPLDGLPGPDDRPATFSIAGRLIARYLADNGR